MPTREQVRSLLESGLSYDEIGRRLGVNAGLAYMIATGIPADGSDSLTEQERARPGFLAASQHLANPMPPANPTKKQHVLTWVKQRAQSDPQMVAAFTGRDPSPASPAEDDDHDLIALITRDHNKVNKLVKQLSAIPGHKKGGTSEQIQRRQKIVDLIAVALSRHEPAEERCLWPTVRKSVTGGKKLADQGKAQETKASQTLTALVKADPDTDAFDELVETLGLQLRQHVSFEEKVLLALKAATTDDERAALGLEFSNAENSADNSAEASKPSEAEHEAQAGQEGQEGSAT
ncbi:MAG: hemerythrin domain-containing protein [Acidothermaceae bacterium]